MSEKQNCWEWKHCGRESGGINVDSLGVCPASIENKMDGVHGGKNGGRTCWVVTATLCKGELQGHFGKKFEKCRVCDFYNQVKLEEGGYFQLSATLLPRLKLI
jgi:hypothetical protein